MKHLFFILLLALCAFCQFEYEDNDEYGNEYDSTASSDPYPITGSCYRGTPGCEGCRYLMNNASVLEVYAKGNACIESGSFYGWGMETVYIHDGITDIMGQVFENCKNLVSISIPNSVRWLGPKSFMGCSKLETVEFRPAPPEPETKKRDEVTKTIQYEAFEDCVSLKSLTIPEDWKEILEKVFKGCTNLETVNILGDIGHLWEFTFQDCENLEEVTFGGPISTVGGYAFWGCSNLKSISFSGLRNIEYNAFESCGVETITFTGGNVLESIGDGAFKYSHLKSITIPETVTSIGTKVFLASGLESVEFLADVEAIPYETFALTSSLKSVTIGGSVKSISPIANPDDGRDYAVFDHSSVESVTFLGNKLKTIGLGAFRYCGNLTSITVPEGVTEIGDYVFEECGLESVTFAGNNLKVVGTQAFSYCHLLKSITFPNSVTKLNDSLFYDSGLESFNFDFPNIDEIPYSFFYDCLNLTSVTIGSSVNKIGAGAFGYTGLKSITIPESVTEMQLYAFAGSMNLESVQFDGELITELPEAAFSWCTELKSITIPKGVTKIGVGAFSGSGLEKIEFAGDSVTTFGEGAFWGCSNLTSITIPSSVNSISDQAFSNVAVGSSLKVAYLGTSDPGKDSEKVFEGTVVDICITDKYTDSSFCGVTENMTVCAFPSSSSSSSSPSSSSPSGSPSSSSPSSTSASSASSSKASSSKASSSKASSSKASSSKASSSKASSSKASSSKASSSKASSSAIRSSGIPYSSVASESSTIKTSSSSVPPEKPVKSSSDKGEEESNVGMIVGIVIAAIIVVAIVVVAICCIVTAGKKHGKVNDEFFEDEEGFVSMSVL